MEKGKVSPLYNNLYLITAVFFTAFLLVWIGGKYLSRTQPKVSLMERVCLSSFGPDEDISWKMFAIGAALFNLPYVASSLMYASVLRFVKYRSKDGSYPPAIYGRFQRNLLTLKETFLLTTVVNILGNILIVTITFAMTSQSEKARIAMFTILLVISLFLASIPVLILYSIKNKIPGIFKKPGIVHPENVEKAFYVRQPTLVPRRYIKVVDDETEDNIVKKPVRTKNKIEEVCSVLRYQNGDSRILVNETL